MTNGMDTTFDLACVAALLLLWERQSARPTRARAIWIGVAGALCYAARPDLALYAVGVPTVVAILTRGESRRFAIASGVLALALIGLEIAFAAWYYASPFPLAFYVKSLNHNYGEAFRKRWSAEPARQIAAYLGIFAPLFVLILLQLPRALRSMQEPAQAVRIGALMATIAYLLYYRFGVVQVVSGHQRFYYPTLPALCLCAASAASDLWREPRPWITSWIERVPRTAVAGVVALAFLSVGPAALDAAHAARGEQRTGQLFVFDAAARFERGASRAARLWFGLTRFSQLPDDLVIATTEVGHPAALNPNKRIVDLAGLNETRFAHEGFSADRLFAMQPDVIYLPHPDYQEMNAALRTHPVLRDDYRVYTKADLGLGGYAYTTLDLALRKSSRHYAELERIVAETRAELSRPTMVPFGPDTQQE
jgi:hypothetical protein